MITVTSLIAFLTFIFTFHYRIHLNIEISTTAMQIIQTISNVSESAFYFTTTNKRFHTENEYKRIFLYVNNLNFVTNNYEIFRPYYVLKEEIYDGENGLVLHEITKTLKRANSAGITDFLIPESTIDVYKIATYQVLTALVKLSFSYDIKINILLDEQFLIDRNSYNYWSNNTFSSYSPNEIFSKNNRLVLDQSNIILKFLIEEKILKFSKCKIQNFYFGENPLYLIPKNNDLNTSELVKFFDYELLYERAKFIFEISDQIKLYYYYDFLLDRNNADIFKSSLNELKYEGSLIYTVWDPYYVTIFPETILSFIFQKLDREHKVVIYNLEIINDSVDYLDVILGIYLFSPVPIVLVVEDKYAFPLYNKILTNQPLLPNEMYVKVNNAYFWVLKIMKENPFFQNNPSLLEDVKLENGLISAITGTKENGNISGLLFLLYNRQDRDFNIDLNQRFLVWSFQTYSILYDSVPREKSYKLNQSGEIYLSRQQILIIQPNLLF